MGCWNQTCSISNLPIAYNDKIVFLPLIIHNTTLLDGISYDVNDKCSPICVPIIGTYDDYGGIENIENQDIVLNCLKSFVFIDANGKEIVDYDNVEDFLEFIIEENVFLKRNSCLYKVTYMMFHYELYQMILKETSNRKPFGKDLTHKELWKNRITCYLEKRKESVTREIDSNTSLTIKNIKNSMRNMLPNTNNETIDELIGDVLTPSYSLKLATSSKNCIVFDYLLNSLVKSFNEVLLSILLDMIMFEKSLIWLRKGYLISTGLGHQGYELKLHLVICEFVNSYVKNRINKFQEEEYLTDDECLELLKEDLFWYD